MIPDFGEADEPVQPATCGTLISPSTCESTMTRSNGAAVSSHQSVFSCSMSSLPRKLQIPPQAASVACKYSEEADTLAQVVAQSHVQDFNRDDPMKKNATTTATTASTGKKRTPHELRLQQQQLQRQSTTPPTPPTRTCMFSTQVSYSEDSTVSLPADSASTTPPGSPGLFSLSSEGESYARSPTAAAAAHAAEVSSCGDHLFSHGSSSSSSNRRGGGCCMGVVTSPSRNPDNLHSILPASLSSPIGLLLNQTQSQRGDWSWISSTEEPAAAAVQQVPQLQPIPQLQVPQLQQCCSSITPAAAAMPAEEAIKCEPGASSSSNWALQNLCAQQLNPAAAHAWHQTTPRESSGSELCCANQKDDDSSWRDYVERVADQQFLGLLGDVVGPSDPFPTNDINLYMESIPFPDHPLVEDSACCHQLFPFETIEPMRIFA